MLKVVTVKMPQELIEAMEEMSRVLGITRSEFIRKAVSHYLRECRKALIPRPKIVKLYS